MIIRSQDKKAIRNFNLISDLVISKDSKGDWDIIACYPYFAQNDCGFATIGTYSTEEKAIKVLDMICHFADKVHLEKLQLNPYRTDGTVFQMPLDEDVEG